MPKFRLTASDVKKFDNKGKFVKKRSVNVSFDCDESDDPYSIEVVELGKMILQEALEQGEIVENHNISILRLPV